MDSNKTQYKAKGHDAVLQRLQEQGSEVEVRTNGGEVYVGKLVARDRFTMSVQLPAGKRAVIYKSAVEAFLF